MSTNPQLELAYDYVCNTDKNIFLTGKAGTGKTTFLHRIKKEAIKRMAVVAPTGVAAINAGGMTIHSLFQLPFGPIVPGAKMDPRQHRFSKKKVSLLKSLDLLVIDEISMVRADVLDGIDAVLRRHRFSSKPFGGVQLLMIGDLNQLPPVVKNEEWNLLSPYYQTLYFFGSRELQRTAPVTIELTHIYRQSDQKFIHLLNKVRDNVLDQSVLTALNSRFKENFSPSEEEGYITLTSHNAAAQSINQERLQALKKTTQKFKANLVGDFPAHAFPTDEELELKKGAQVMFVKNDPNPEKLFFNGKIGRIVRFGDDAIYIKCPDDAEEIAVTRLEWNNTKYQLNEKTKEVESEVMGTFTQYPLKLAWAITIHKSQGLTFDRAIIDAEAAFAHGQVYVALSRCRSFEGIVLRSKLSFSSVKTDRVVKSYNEEARRNKPDEKALENSKKEFQQKLVYELFDFADCKRAIGYLNRILFEKASSFQGKVIERLDEIKHLFEENVFLVAKKFEVQISQILSQSEMPEQNDQLQERIKKASVYFSEKLDKEIHPRLSAIQIMTDNQAAEKKAIERLEDLKTLFFIKSKCLEKAKSGFTARAYIREKSNADIDYLAESKKSKRSAKKVDKDLPNPALYRRLITWRNKIADKEGIRSNEVIGIRTALELSKYLPTSTKGLKNIQGFGETKLKKYGGVILKMIEQYAEDNDIPSFKLDLHPQEKAPKVESKKLSFELFKSGKDIPAIAEERQLAESTVQSHLAQFVKSGELDIHQFLERKAVEEIISFFENNETTSATPAKEFFGDRYSYGDIRMVLNFLEGEKMRNKEE